MVFIGSLTTYYYIVESGFNPFPQPTSLQGASICYPARQPCPGFSLGNANLRSLNRTDINSQQLSLTVTSEDAGQMARIDVYMDNVSLGEVEGPFEQGTPRLVALGVPTTITVTPGMSYEVVVEGTYPASSSAPQLEYWQSISVVASGG